MSRVVCVHEERLKTLLLEDSQRLQVLWLVSTPDLPECYVAAGFVLNLIWDELHQFQKTTSLNDVDVIYFSRDGQYADASYYEKLLQQTMPHLHWQVKNQAVMHAIHGHSPYASILEAMYCWPEKETAIAVRLLAR